MGTGSDMASPSMMSSMVEILLDIGALGGSYISLALWRGLKNLLRRYIDTSSAGSLEAANPSYSDTAPMRSLGSAVVSVLLESDRRVRNVVVCTRRIRPTLRFHFRSRLS